MISQVLEMRDAWIILLLASLCSSKEPHRVEEHIFCQFEKARAACDADEIIVVESAQYGRMGKNRCISRSLAPDEICYRDITNAVNERCANLPECLIDVASLPQIFGYPCAQSLLSALKLRYWCTKVEPDWLSKAVKRQFVRPGHDLILHCPRVDNSKSMVWTHSEPGTEKKTRYVLMEENELVIYNFQSKDAGVYQCQYHDNNNALETLGTVIAVVDETPESHFDETSKIPANNAGSVAVSGNIMEGTYCQFEDITIRCPLGTSVRIDKAQYGNSKSNRCIKETGYCTADVTTKLREWCKNSQSCEIEFPLLHERFASLCSTDMPASLSLKYGCFPDSRKQNSKRKITLNVNVGDNVILPCYTQVSGSKLIWMKGDFHLSSGNPEAYYGHFYGDSRFKVRGNGETNLDLAISNVMKSYADVFTCLESPLGMGLKVRVTVYLTFDGQNQVVEKAKLNYPVKGYGAGAQQPSKADIYRDNRNGGNHHNSQAREPLRTTTFIIESILVWIFLYIAMAYILYCKPPRSRRLAPISRHLKTL